MTEILKPNKPRFNQTTYYNSLNKVLMLKGVFNGAHLEKDGAVLDIGCGESFEILFLAERKKNINLIVGLDVKPHKNWKKAISYHNLHFIVADAHHIPFRSKVFNFVFLKDVLHHVPAGKPRIINEAYNVVKKGGTFKLIEANRYNINPILVFKNDRSHDHFSLEQLNGILNSLSFDTITGFELLPSFSNSVKDFFWNLFVLFFWFSTTSTLTRYCLSLYLKMKEKLLQRNLTYYALTKRKRET